MLLFLPLLLQAQAIEAPAPLKPVGKWNVDFAGATCAFSRDFGDANNRLTLEISRSPVRKGTTLVLTQAATSGGKRAKGNLTMTLLPNNEDAIGRFTGTSSDDKVSQAWSWSFSDLPLDKLAEAAEIRLATNKQPPVTLSVPTIKSAVSLLATCRSNLQNEWRVDPAALDAIKTDSLLAISPSDAFEPQYFLPAAEKVAPDRKSTVLLTIGVNGNASECRMIGTSGVPAYDTRVCQVAMARLRFTAAVGYDGKPVVSYMTFGFAWQAPGHLYITSP